MIYLKALTPEEKIRLAIAVNNIFVTYCEVEYEGYKTDKEYVEFVYGPHGRQIVEEITQTLGDTRLRDVREALKYDDPECELYECVKEILHGYPYKLREYFYEMYYDEIM